MPEKSVSIIKYLMLAVLIQCFAYSIALAQLNENCTVLEAYYSSLQTSNS